MIKGNMTIDFLLLIFCYFFYDSPVIIVYCNIIIHIFLFKIFIIFNLSLLIY